MGVYSILKREYGVTLLCGGTGVRRPQMNAGLTTAGTPLQGLLAR